MLGLIGLDAGQVPCGVVGEHQPENSGAVQFERHVGWLGREGRKAILDLHIVVRRDSEAALGVDLLCDFR